MHMNIKKSTSQQNTTYNPYSRILQWAQPQLMHSVRLCNIWHCSFCGSQLCNKLVIVCVCVIKSLVLHMDCKYKL